MLDPSLALAIRSSTPVEIAMTMNWRDLLFLHFSCEPEVIQAILPPGPAVDTFPDESGEERAWIGLVPFRMESVRPSRWPRLRPCEDFEETNVRTYCHVNGKNPGVWFFSLDAANPFACAYARLRYRLNYREAFMTVERDGDEVRYASRRWRSPQTESRAICRVGSNIGPANPGTLEFFLVERYLLYSYKGSQLYKGQVYHPPYQLRAVESYEGSSGLVQVNGIEPRPFDHALFCDGVDVSAGPVMQVG